MPSLALDEESLIVFYHAFSAKGLKGPWLLFVSEGGYGKRVHIRSFRTSQLNRVGLMGYKVGLYLNFMWLNVRIWLHPLKILSFNLSIDRSFRLKTAWLQFLWSDSHSQVIRWTEASEGDQMIAFLYANHFAPLSFCFLTFLFFLEQRMGKVMNRWFWLAKVELLTELRLKISQYSLVKQGKQRQYLVSLISHILRYWSLTFENF